MAKTVVGYPDEPSRKAMIVAFGLLTVGGGYFVAKKKDPILKAAASAAVPLFIKPLAMWLTKMGLV
jgi:hypothetical protein